MRGEIVLTYVVVAAPIRPGHSCLSANSIVGLVEAHEMGAVSVVN